LKNPELQNQKSKYCGATKLERWGSTLLEVTGFLSEFYTIYRIIFNTANNITKSKQDASHKTFGLNIL
jgi:hypothetical protein